MKKATLRFYPKLKKVKISANSTDFYPEYLKYLLEYYKIPKRTTIEFKDKIIKGGIEEWLDQERTQ